MKQYIDIVGKWDIVIYYMIDETVEDEVVNILSRLNCYNKDINKILYLAYNTYNTGASISNFEYKISIVFINNATTGEQFLDTFAHEITHVAVAIARYYEVDKESEEFAYLLGYIARKAYSYLINIINAKYFK